MVDQDLPDIFSTNNKRNANMQKFIKENKIINKEKSNDKIVNDSHVNLNLDKMKKSKIKLVHFAQSSIFDNNNNNYYKRNEFFKNYNVKSLSGLNNKTVNFGMEPQNKTMTNNIIIKETNEKKKIFIQTKTEYSQRNKSTVSKKPNLDESKSKSEMTLSNMINDRYEKSLKNFINIDDKNFNIFDFESKVGKENTLLFIGKYIFNYFKFGEIINQAKYDNWVERIAKGYDRKNFYHHDLHAADITHTSYIYFRYGLINEIVKLDNSMICAVIIGCICHDYKHPGLNNNYLIDTNNEIALNYNDISVLENMHISESFKLMYNNPNCNVFEGFDKEKYKIMRKQMILCVLSTDI